MTSYSQKDITGELWLRTPEGNRENASILLSSVYTKYSAKYPTFFSELTSSNILKFDTFYDCIFLETPSGCIFEKIQNVEDIIIPFNYTNLFTAKYAQKAGFLSFNTPVDYWFDEENKKVFYTNLVALDENKYFSNQFALGIMVNVFDCELGQIETVMFDKLVLVYTDSRNWNLYDYILEAPKITYNSTTHKFNVSFLLKNQTRQMGLISINFKRDNSSQKNQYIATEVNGHLPFFDLNLTKSYIIPYTPGTRMPYRIVTIAENETFPDGTIDPAYNLKFILASVSESVVDENGNVSEGIVNKYLVTE